MIRRLILLVLVCGIAAAGLYGLSRSRTFQLFGELVTSVDTDRRVVALTFDDGPSARFTGDLLDALADANVRATFFLVGQDIVANPEQAAAIVAAGHQIGNHSWDHPRMVLMSPRAVRRQIEQTDAAIRDLGYDGPILFRAPFGKKLFVLPWVLSRMDRTNVMWSLAPESVLGQGASAEEIAEYTVARAAPGDIILLHGMFTGNAATRDALPEIIAGLQAAGFGFVTLDEMLSD